MEKYQQYALSISATTRQPRAGEVDGREYFFVSREAFQKMIEENALIEYAQYVENYYGTPREYVEKQLAAGRDVILEIEIQGALRIREQYPDALLLFVTPPSAEELKRRLIGRGTESEEVIEARLRRAVEEAEGVEAYDYIVVNDQLEACTERLHQLIEAQHSRIGLQKDFLDQIRQELKQFS